MSEIDYTIEKTHTIGMHSRAYVLEGEDPATAVLEDAWQSLGTEIELTIGGVTMFAAAWSDPEHWSDDWREKLDCGHEEVEDRVAAIFAEAAS